ncbi:fatty acid desaturase family protein [Amycolatopsis aidingensis]|uniref:fatty acid desaturase family protein n=1 Tax=Amycolatopsis aidingensis TaxID=2842453 RepID=UPI001C0DE705|nr:fatty acid desaturase [Amycolatopsis aidingensis]
MKIWKNTPKDSILVGISLTQFAVTPILAITWDTASLPIRIAGGVLITLMMTYNIIVVSHLFTHVPWFVSNRLNAVVSVVNSVNIGQSVQAYQLTHVRNHHRFNNDRQGPDGTTRDASSTYRRGKNGQHEPLLSYALGGAVDSIVGRVKDVGSTVRLWKVGRGEEKLLSLASRRETRRVRELRQVQADRAAHCLSLVVFATISWQWTVFCYLPAFFIALTLVNVQNYYRHYGANPEDRASDSVSHYNRVYNFLTFNDGYHQEHHLSPGTHWSRMPEVKERQRAKLEAQPRIVSPVPALLGFLDRRRPLLHESKPERTG